MIAKPAQTQTAQPSFRVSDERLIKITASAAKRVSTLLQKQGRPNGVLRVSIPATCGHLAKCFLKLPAVKRQIVDHVLRKPAPRVVVAALRTDEDLQRRSGRSR